MATIRRHRNKYQVQIRKKGLPQLSRSFHQFKDAKQWARELEIKADKQELSHDLSILRQLTVGDLVGRYLSAVTPMKRGADYEVTILRSFLRHPICRKNLADISVRDFTKYRDERLLQIKPVSLRRQLNPIQNMFEIARDEWGIPIKENPLTKLKLKAVDNRRQRRLKDGELERILEAGNRTKNPLIIPVVLFAIETGMRRGEILSLCWDQVDFKRSSVTILESKNGYSRMIPLTSTSIYLLKLVMVLQKGISNGIVYNTNRLVSTFINNYYYKNIRTASYDINNIGKMIDLDDLDVADQLWYDLIESNEPIFPITPNALGLSWGRLCKRAGIKDLHFHDLRHEAISRFFEMGLTVPEVASISGHRDMRMLLRYAHANFTIMKNKIN